MSIISAKEVNTDDIISSKEILELIGQPCKVVSILKYEGDSKIKFRLVPESMPDSLLILRHDAEENSLFIKR